MAMDYLPSLREDYIKGGLLEKDVLTDPFQQFHRWFEDAVSARQIEPNAMTLATVDGNGQPHARIVLLKNLDARGFIFFTNYQSDKAQNLDANPRGALVFWWSSLERQVRLEGQIAKISPQESDDYFYSRPLGSQLGAWASPQSQIIDSRQVLDEGLRALEEKYQDQKVPRPEHWGGFRLIPARFEFWQGRSNRLHDRLCYTPDNQGWQIQRLAP